MGKLQICPHIFINLQSPESMMSKKQITETASCFRKVWRARVLRVAAIVPGTLVLASAFARDACARAEVKKEYVASDICKGSRYAISWK